MDYNWTLFNWHSECIRIALVNLSGMYPECAHSSHILKKSMRPAPIVENKGAFQNAHILYYCLENKGAFQNAHILYEFWNAFWNAPLFSRQKAQIASTFEIWAMKKLCPRRWRLIRDAWFQMPAKVTIPHTVRQRGSLLEGVRTISNYLFKQGITFVLSTSDFLKLITAKTRCLLIEGKNILELRFHFPIKKKLRSLYFLTVKINFDAKSWF